MGNSGSIITALKINMNLWKFKGFNQPDTTYFPSLHLFPHIVSVVFPVSGVWLVETFKLP